MLERLSEMILHWPFGDHYYNNKVFESYHEVQDNDGNDHLFILVIPQLYPSYTSNYYVMIN